MTHGLEVMKRLNDEACLKKMVVKHVAVVLDGGSNHEAIYVDGKYVFSDLTIFASDIAEAAGESLIRFEQIASPDVPGEWPELLSDIEREPMQ